MLEVRLAIGYFSVRDDSAFDHCTMGCALLPVLVGCAVGIAALHELAVFDLLAGYFSRHPCRICAGPSW